MIYPLISAVSQASVVIVDKITLSRQKVSPRLFMPALFLLLFLGSILLLPWIGWVETSVVWQGRTLILFSAMLICAVLWNIPYYEGLEKERVQEFELVMMLGPLVTALLAIAFLPAERNWQIIVPTLVASLSVVISHLKKDHLDFSRYTPWLLAALFFMSLETVFIRLLLDIFSPAALYAFRTGIIFVFFLIFYRPNFAQIAPRHWAWIGASSVLSIALMVTRFYGYAQLGVLTTTLILALTPMLVYAFDVFLLKERVKRRNILAAIIVLLCIVYVEVIR